MSDNETSNQPPLGAVYLSRSGSSVGKFQFIVDPEGGESVEISTPVAAETKEGVVVGVVEDMTVVGQGTDPISYDIRNGGDPDEFGGAPDIVDALVASVQVFDSKRLRPVRAGKVRPATGDEMRRATGEDRMGWTIPVGVMRLADDSYVPISLDGDYLLGSEGAHLTVSGLSGLAAKTSFAGVAMRSCIAAGGRHNKKVGILVVNVKGDDLIYLDQAPTDGYALTDDDRAMYEALGIPAEPFENVTVYSPGLAMDDQTWSSRDDALPLRWDLKIVWPYLRYILPEFGNYDDAIVQNFLADFENRCLNTSNRADRIDTFQALNRWFGQMLNDPESQEGWGSHHRGTLQRMWRRLGSLPNRCGGLLSTENERDANGRPEHDIPDEGWEHGKVVVADLAGLKPEVQGLVLGRTLARLTQSAERGSLGVDHLVIFTDELNQYAPASGGDMSAVRSALVSGARLGRAFGISIWGAAQQLSKVSEDVTSQAATRVIGVTAPSELSSPVYGRLTAGMLERFSTLPKGQVALQHYSFRSPVIVRFPRPAWRTGKLKGAQNRRPRNLTEALGLTDSNTDGLTEGMAPEAVEEIIAGAPTREAAIEALRQARSVSPKKGQVVGRTHIDPDDPFAIDEE